MGTGFLKIQLYVGDFALHGDSVTVFVKKDGQILHTLKTNENGATEVVSIESPDLDGVDGLELDKKHYATVDVEVPRAQGYLGVKVLGVQIFDGITSILNVHLIPTTPGKSEEDIEIHIQQEHGVDIDRDNGHPNNMPVTDSEGTDFIDNMGYPMDLEAYENQAQMVFDEDPDPAAIGSASEINAPEAGGFAGFVNDPTNIPAAAISPLNVPFANEVVIPEHITVHLGTPNTAARNVRVPFKDYIINVVCSEIYPFWEVAAIEANTHAIVSFTLNRLFTNAHRLGNQEKWRKYGVCWQYDFTQTEEIENLRLYMHQLCTDTRLIITANTQTVKH